jgi:N-acetylmuramoyl-L-alanine amidase
MSTTYTVKPGDTLLSIAAARGFRDWRRIWDDAGNAGLRAKRPNPQVLYEGDEIQIPELFGAPRDCDTGKTHTFKLKMPAAFFAVRLVDELGQPYKSARWQLEVDGKSYGGTTDGDGWLSQAVDPRARYGRLKLFRSDRDDDVCEWRVRIGSMDPVDTVSGVQGRLANLGFAPGQIDGYMSDETRQAIRTFQMHIGHPSPSGELDDRTRQALVDAQNEY